MKRAGFGFAPERDRSRRSALPDHASGSRFGVARSLPGIVTLHSASMKKKSPNITALSTP
jgi:hypothetical protein